MRGGGVEELSEEVVAARAFLAAAFGDTAGLAPGIGRGPWVPALVVLRTDDLDAARRAVEAAGGAVTRPPFAIPGGRSFHARAPCGLELALWQPG